MLDAYQIYEARSLGADCILLIMACLPDDKARELFDLTKELGMDVLVEVHNKEELDRALDLPAKLIGVNNRNLKTLEISLETTKELAKHIPQDREIVCESGLYQPDDLASMLPFSVERFLIGELLMRQKNVREATQNILSKVSRR